MAIIRYLNSSIDPGPKHYISTASIAAPDEHPNLVPGFHLLRHENIELLITSDGE
jgi:hypothetical protein